MAVRLPRHHEKRQVPYSPEQMFALVADVERYPEFLPWCVATRIRSRDEFSFTADLIAAFAAFREQYTSRVNLSPADNTIVIEYLQGPFEHLTNRWVFIANDKGCEVDFDIDFRFRSKTLETLISGVFTKAIRKMTESFEQRAHKLYGGAPAAPAAQSNPDTATSSS
jgi:coenzyme Q-binding protein COQ10